MAGFRSTVAKGNLVENSRILSGIKFPGHGGKQNGGKELW
jgi:hypothetical protein